MGLILGINGDDMGLILGMGMIWLSYTGNGDDMGLILGMGMIWVCYR